MDHTPIGDWLLLALCGALNAVVSLFYFSHAARGFHSTSAMVFLGSLTLAAGACALAAGVWNLRNRNSWLLVLNGLAGCILGLIFTFWRGPLGFRTIALLIVGMAASIGVYELMTARSMPRDGQGAGVFWLRLAGAVSVGFALALCALGLRWITIERGPVTDFLGLGAYFAFTAICMAGLAVRFSRAGSPRHAH